jgi:putative heme degradation protein
MNRATGDYAFGAPLGTASVKKLDLRIYPNPSQNVWNVASANEAITAIQIVDVLGKTVLTVAPQATSAVIDAAALNSGIYFARIATATGTSTIKVVRN